MRLQHEEDPRAHVSDKIRKCCIFAEKEGFEWLWIDTCCIDKSSSAELSEAINSMYAWYAAADICYVYMHDVEDVHPSRDESFSRSVWFTRGWTLQELIAPHHVVFLSQEWHTLGTKQTLAHLIEDVSGVDYNVLLRSIDLSQISIARRMSWAAKRSTTREEDRAYSLMGIFNVYMPTIYGEGSRAFERLQLEILKRSPDQSILAWGPLSMPWEHVTYSTPVTVDRAREIVQQPRSLLASSPSEFANSADISPMLTSTFNEIIGNEDMLPPEYTPTSHGMRANLPTLPAIGRNPAVICAVLACQDAHDNLIILLLSQPRANNYYLYHVGADMTTELPGAPRVTDYHRLGRLPRRSIDPTMQANIRPLNMYIDFDRSSPRPSGMCRSISNSSAHDHNLGIISYAFFFPTWVFKSGRMRAVPDETPEIPDSDGLILEVSPNSRPRRTVIFARIPGNGPNGDTGSSSPEGFRLNISLDCGCSSDPLQHPVSFTVDMISPAPDTTRDTRQPRANGRRPRSLSNMLESNTFVQMMLQTPPSPSRPQSDVLPGVLSEKTSPTFSSHSSLQSPSTSGLEEAGAWQCANKRTHLPTISNPYLLLKFFSGLGRVEITLKRWEGCHRSKDRKSTRLNSSHSGESRMPSSA